MTPTDVAEWTLVSIPILMIAVAMFALWEACRGSR